MLDNGDDFVLIDVRAPEERDVASIGGVHIPLQHLSSMIEDIILEKNKLIVVYCRSGARSLQAAQYMKAIGYDRVMNLEGGILSWIERIDPTLTAY